MFVLYCLDYIINVLFIILFPTGIHSRTFLRIMCCPTLIVCHNQAILKLYVTLVCQLRASDYIFLIPSYTQRAVVILHKSKTFLSICHSNILWYSSPFPVNTSVSYVTTGPIMLFYVFNFNDLSTAFDLINSEYA